MGYQRRVHGGVSDFNLRSFIILPARSHTSALAFRALISWLVDSQIPRVICTQIPNAAQQSHQVLVLDRLRSSLRHSQISWTTSHTRVRLTSAECITKARQNII